MFQEINFDSPRGGVSVITEKGDVTTSYLYIQRAKNSDNGEYKCSPSNANNVTVRVYVLKGYSNVPYNFILFLFEYANYFFFLSFI